MLLVSIVMLRTHTTLVSAYRVTNSKKWGSDMSSEQLEDAKYLRYDYLMLQDALDWVGIDYLVRQTDDKEQTQVTINSTDAKRLAQLIQVGSKHQ